MSCSASATLLENVSSAATGQWKDYPGGHSVLTIVGTWTGTINFQVLGPDGNALTIIGTATPIRNANTQSIGALAPGKYRVDMSGATGVSGVWATIERVPY